PWPRNPALNEISVIFIQVALDFPGQGPFRSPRSPFFGVGSTTTFRCFGLDSLDCPEGKSRPLPILDFLLADVQIDPFLPRQKMVTYTEFSLCPLLHARSTGKKGVFTCPPIQGYMAGYQPTDPTMRQLYPSPSPLA